MDVTETRELERILITGATGFIGAATVPPLQARFPAAVVGALVRSERAAAAVQALGLVPVHGDLGDPQVTLDAALREFAPDAIIHLAAEIASSRDLAAIERTNVQGTRHLAHAARNLPHLRCFLYASTVVTGDAQGRVLTEDGDIPLETDYGRAKHEGERALRDLGLPYVIVRPSHVYGPGGWFAGVVTDLRRGLFRVPGRGDNWWDVVHVDDVASAVVLALAVAAPRSVYHVVDDEPVRMDDFFQEAARLCGRHRVGHAPIFLARLLRGKGAVAAAVRSARSSNARLRQLGWAPRYPTYKSGLAATMAALASAAA